MPRCKQRNWPGDDDACKSPCQAASEGSQNSICAIRGSGSSDNSSKCRHPNRPPEVSTTLFKAHLVHVGAIESIFAAAFVWIARFAEKETLRGA